MEAADCSITRCIDQSLPRVAPLLRTPKNASPAADAPSKTSISFLGMLEKKLLCQVDAGGPRVHHAELPTWRDAFFAVAGGFAQHLRTHGDVIGIERPICLGSEMTSTDPLNLRST